MKTLIVSDLHWDYNSNKLGMIVDYGFEQNINDYDLVLIAGDIAGNYTLESMYLSKLKNKITGDTKVCVVSGNHLGYERVKSGFENTKEHALLTLRKVYNDKPIYYMENDILEIDDYVVIGCCLYTDFTLNNNQIGDQRKSELYINDFRYVQTIDYDNSLIRNVMSEDYIKWHKRSVDFIQKACEKYKNKKIILLTHFLVTPKSISEKYVGDDLNAFYCTDLEWLLKENKNIILVASGHSHEKSDTNVGDTRVVLEPYGYFMHGQHLLPEEYNGKEVIL